MDPMTLSVILGSVGTLVAAVAPVIVVAWKGAFNTVGMVVDGHYGRKSDNKKKYDPTENKAMDAINKNSSNAVKSLSRLPDNEMRRQERQLRMDKKTLKDDLYIREKEDDLAWKQQKREWIYEKHEARKQYQGNKQHKK